MRICEEILFFKATYNTKTNKQFASAGWILAEGRGRETDLTTPDNGGSTPHSKKEEKGIPYRVKIITAFTALEPS